MTRWRRLIRCRRRSPVAMAFGSSVIHPRPQNWRNAATRPTQHVGVRGERSRRCFTTARAFPNAPIGRKEGGMTETGRPKLDIGSDAPLFTLPGAEGREIDLSALRGRKVVLYFYPKDDTSGCTA